ncbi:dTDP-4-dehydrorhamnose reductase, partial [Fodinicurvata halophila]|uniref:dTDP-4-dehydrorhamnose reductase n=1 Tax=Fodinicurvata halophila TaxID=1419723 RepID=UPI003613E6F7
LRPEARGRMEMDLTDPAAVQAAVAERPWAAVVNAAAYTAVDQAESEAEAAYALNRDGPAALARACRAAGLPLIHISTDYVFDGQKDGAWQEDDPINPQSVYGASKAAGEVEVRATLPQHVILRTAWVFSDSGHNFVKTMLRVGAERDELRIVDDQRGSPTAADDIAAATVTILERLLSGRGAYGTFHFANSGTTSWYGFAQAIFEEVAARGQNVPRLTPIPTRDYPTPAARPMNSVLDCRRIAQTYGITPRPWAAALSDTLDSLLPEPAAAQSPAIQTTKGAR